MYCRLSLYSYLPKIVMLYTIDCKTVGFFLKISKEIGFAWRKSLMREPREPQTPVGRCEAREKKPYFFSVSPQSHSLFSASFHTFCLTARAYLNTQKYGLFCSLVFLLLLCTFLNTVLTV